MSSHCRHTNRQTDTRVPRSPATDAQIDFLSGLSALHADKPVTPAPPRPPNSRRNYVLHRLQLWDAPSDPKDVSVVELGVISWLLLALQVAFRWKTLSIFALQLLFIWTIVGVCAYVPRVNNAIKTQFQGQIEYRIGASAGVVVLLMLLYLIQLIFPLNWLVLIVFNVAQAPLFAILGIKLDTNLAFFNCDATFSCILRSRMRRCHLDQQPTLFSPINAGFIAYLVVALASCGLFIQYGREFVTPEGFGTSLGFQFVLIICFAIDASSVYRVMPPDEYMHDAIYFYTDVVLLVAISAIGVEIGALLVFMFGDGCDYPGCDCCSDDCTFCDDGCCATPSWMNNCSGPRSKKAPRSTRPIATARGQIAFFGLASIATAVVVASKTVTATVIASRTATTDVVVSRIAAGAKTRASSSY